LGMLAIVSAHGAGQSNGEDYLLGIALALGAAFLYAIAALIIKRLSGTPPHLIALIQVTTGVLLLAPWVTLGGLPVEVPALASLLTLGMVHT
ncbi:EamA/RhaT family transporter, partial [Salmonella enterica subsp. enterica serovar Typhimurium]|nr:EamA/RhaT family transporter [Salmonella enterica subsp. enterica serovar Typhimurium]